MMIRDFLKNATFRGMLILEHLSLCLIIISFIPLLALSKWFVENLINELNLNDSSELITH